MLDHAWLIPIIPAVSFALILFFGKRMPRKGSEIGITAVGASFVLSCVTAVQWIQRVNDHEEGGAGHAIGGFLQGARADGRSGGARPSGVTAVIHSVTWWQNGGVKFAVGTQIDGLAVMMLFVVTLISLLVHIYSTAYMHGDVRYTYFFAA